MVDSFAVPKAQHLNGIKDERKLSKPLARLSSWVILHENSYLFSENQDSVIFIESRVVGRRNCSEPNLNLHL